MFFGGLWVFVLAVFLGGSVVWVGFLGFLGYAAAAVMILQGGSVEQLISTNSNHFKFRYPNEYLGGGNSNIFEIFTPNFGEDSKPILTNFHIFQMGWGTNHQPDMCSYPEPLNFTLIECRKLYKDQRLQSCQPTATVDREIRCHL